MVLDAGLLAATNTPSPLFIRYPLELRKEKSSKDKVFDSEILMCTVNARH